MCPRTEPQLPLFNATSRAQLYAAYCIFAKLIMKTSKSKMLIVCELVKCLSEDEIRKRVLFDGCCVMIAQPRERILCCSLPADCHMCFCAGLPWKTRSLHWTAVLTPSSDRRRWVERECYRNCWSLTGCLRSVLTDLFSSCGEWKFLQFSLKII